MTEADRLFLINIRSLLLKCVDLLDRKLELGKYRPTHPVNLSPSDSVAGIIDTVARAKTESNVPSV